MNAKIRKGLIFTADIAIGLLILLTILFSSQYLFSVPESYSEKFYEQMNLVSTDLLNSLTELKVYEAANLSPTINNLISNKSLTEDELEISVFNLILTLWAQGDDENNETKKELAKNITKELISSIGNFSQNFNLSIIAYNTTIYGNYTALPKTKNIVSAALVESSYGSGKPKYGYTARAYLTDIDKEDSSYLYFGGFVGQGNISTILKLPSDANITQAYLEAYAGTSFDIYLNGNFSGNFTPTTFSNFSANVKGFVNETNLKPGNNIIEIRFTSGNITDWFIGGGFLRVTYKTSKFYEIREIGKKKYYFPGINGLINLYDSFYIPGDLNNMSIYLHYNNNVTGSTIYLTIANATVFRSNATGEQNIVLNNTYILSNLTSNGLSYANISKKTVPLRLGTETLALEQYFGVSDAILITDVSGSMGWRMDMNSVGGIDRACNDPNLEDPSTQRISVAKCVDKDFVDGMLNVSGNRVGLVSFTTSIDKTHELSDNITSLKNQIDSYTPLWRTCICCGINEAMDLLQKPYMVELITQGDVWKYTTNYPTTEPPVINGFDWKSLEYNDTNWSSGKAILGFEKNASWYFQGWDYRVPIDISNTAGNLTDYQIKITYNFSEDYSNGDIQQYCQDIRFTYYNFTSGNQTEIPYWIENCNLSASDNATIWVKVPFLENSTSTRIYMYYGNSTVSSESNGDAVFEFFDDFEGTTLNLTKWTHIEGSYSISDSAFHGNGGDSIEWIRTRTYQISGSALIKFKMKPDFSSGDWDAGIGVGTSGEGVASGFIDDYSTGDPMGILDNIWIWWVGFSNTDIARSDFNTYHIYKVVIDSSTNTRYFYDLTDGRTHSRSGIELGYVWLITDSEKPTRDTSYDWIFASKYVNPEPTITFGIPITTDIGNNGGNYYFRKKFYLTGHSIINESTLYVYSDDNAEVYLNGHLIDNDTQEHAATYWNRIVSVNTTYFREGENIVAVKLRNNDNESAKFDLKLEAIFERRKAMLVMSDGQANEECAEQGWTPDYSGDGLPDQAEDDAIQAGCDARDQGILVYSVAFGSAADATTLQKIACWNCSANDWIPGEAGNNCSRFYQSSNVSELKQIYKKIAQEIANLSLVKQIMKVKGNITWENNFLYNDSYVELYYNETPPNFDFGEFSLTIEKNFTSQGKVDLIKPNETELLEAEITSYSGDYWTSLVTVNNFVGNFTVYNLSVYGGYSKLGDPFIVSIPTNYITNGTNNITLFVGLGENNQTLGSKDSKLIYKLKVPGYVDYGSTFNTSEEAKEDAVNRLINKIYNLTNINISGWGIVKATEPIRGVGSIYAPSLVKVIIWEK